MHFGVLQMIRAFCLPFLWFIFTIICRRRTSGASSARGGAAAGGLGGMLSFRGASGEDAAGGIKV